MIATVQQRARDLVDRAGVPQGAAVLVACSGGPDSTVAADVAADLAAAGRLGAVTLLYVDHGLRAGSAADAEIVHRLARSLSARAPVASRAEAVTVDRDRASLEAAARDARYACLERVARDIQAAVVILGHTASDQAETVLMRVIRGTGVAGLAAIPLRRARYVRPLLSSTREDIEAYLAERGYAAARDPMNQDPRFLRVRVRERILPGLRAENPRIDEALVRLAAGAAEDRAVLDYAAACLLGRGGTGPVWQIACADLLEAPPAVAKRAILLAAERLGGGEIGAAHLEAALDIARGPDAGSRNLDLPGLVVTREYGALRLRAAGEVTAREAAVEIQGPDGPYALRPWRSGDRMRPQRLKGRSRKLSDLLGDAKIPQRLRRQARVAVRESDDEIVWAEHVGIAFGAAIEVRLTGPDPVASNKC